jgi:hypothetical protein
MKVLAAGAPVGSSEANQVYFVPLFVALLLLLEAELCRAAGGPRAQVAARILNIAAIAPVVAFFIVVVIRLNEIL